MKHLTQGFIGIFLVVSLAVTAQAQPHDPTGHGQDRPSGTSTSPTQDRLKVDRNDYGESTKQTQNPTTGNSTIPTVGSGARSTAPTARPIKTAVKPKKPK